MIVFDAGSININFLKCKNNENLNLKIKFWTDCLQRHINQNMQIVIFVQVAYTS